ncbi:hypothetical protein ABH913_002226 [Pseudomonas sp. ILQ215 TE3946]
MDANADNQRHQPQHGRQTEQAGTGAPGGYVQGVMQSIEKITAATAGFRQDLITRRSEKSTVAIALKGPGLKTQQRSTRIGQFDVPLHERFALAQARDMRHHAPVQGYRRIGRRQTGLRQHPAVQLTVIHRQAAHEKSNQ